MEQQCGWSGALGRYVTLCDFTLLTHQVSLVLFHGYWWKTQDFSIRGLSRAPVSSVGSSLCQQILRGGVEESRCVLCTGFGLHLRNTELVESLLSSGKQACSLPQRKTLSLKVAGYKYIPER